MKVIVLDAMGVIFAVRDDVKDLLEPFIKEKGGITDQSKIWNIYRSASSGRMCSSELWQAVGLNPDVEDEYLLRYELTSGIIDFLNTIKSIGYIIWYNAALLPSFLKYPPF